MSPGLPEFQTIRNNLEANSAIGAIEVQPQLEEAQHVFSLLNLVS